MKKILLIISILAITSLCYSVNPSFMDIQGKWKLMYSAGYGYELRFNKGYRAFCILYQGSHAVIFKGIYTIEEGNKIRINVNEMKQAKLYELNLTDKFVKASSSYFVFKSDYVSDKKGKYLILNPVISVIDGNDSQGYFEPEVKLTKM